MAHFVELDQGDQIELTGAARLAVICKTGRRTRFRIECDPDVEIVRVPTDHAGVTEARARVNQDRHARRYRRCDRPGQNTQDDGADDKGSSSA